MKTYNDYQELETSERKGARKVHAALSKWKDGRWTVDIHLRDDQGQYVQNLETAWFESEGEARDALERFWQ